MATVTAFQIEGLKIWFWSDDHEPPHFHIKRSGEWEMRVSFLSGKDQMVEIMRWSKKSPSAKLQDEICTLAETHRAALLRQWEQVHQN